MEREYIESSMIRSIGFDPNTSTLEIEFNSGAVWQYFDFPESSWYEFRNSESKGKYFNREIRNHYRESRVG
ncbi:KTSC domain-containing protein [Desulfotomaculum arcticum]|uniref:KTSC domain-containing protein n=1 Tax=Desulfotruncus arcticus DSM 17038 TaxID=1121424 RepID=A0A1I2VU22_9FIRM|nr:KTSC domain-containing protein [Desulfotruncus arcticus]SFG92583.1 KTSC domain-containing protein [Desulfotomaculum arcticum] [Desulfotruncus arcticus DSM 17038]